MVSKSAKKYQDKQKQKNRVSKPVKNYQEIQKVKKAFGRRILNLRSKWWHVNNAFNEVTSEIRKQNSITKIIDAEKRKLGLVKKKINFDGIHVLKSDIENAVNILNAREKKPKQKKNLNKIRRKCKTTIENSERWNLSNATKATPEFAPTLIVQEMRKCVLSHDWDGLTKLLVIFYDAQNMSYLKWRYAFINFLNNPAPESGEIFQEFLTMCISCQSPEDQDFFMRSLLSLNITDSAVSSEDKSTPEMQITTRKRGRNTRTFVENGVQHSESTPQSKFSELFGPGVIDSESDTNSINTPRNKTARDTIRKELDTTKSKTRVAHNLIWNDLNEFEPDIQFTTRRRGRISSDSFETGEKHSETETQTSNDLIGNDRINFEHEMESTSTRSKIRKDVSRKDLNEIEPIKCINKNKKPRREPR